MSAARLQHPADMDIRSPAVFKVCIHRQKCRISQSHGHGAFCGASLETKITEGEITKLMCCEVEQRVLSG